MKTFLKIFLHLVVQSSIFKVIAGQDNPCFTGWLYSQLNGRCYQAQSAKLTQEKAAASCSSLLPDMKPRLLTITTRDDAVAMSNVMIKISNNVEYWMDARFDTVNKDLLEQLSPGFLTNGDGLCLTFQYVYDIGGGADGTASFQVNYRARRKKCEDTGWFLCQHDAVTCNPMELQTQDQSTEMVPNLSTVFTYVRVACRSGFFRQSELPNAVVAATPSPGSVPFNYAYCTGTADPTMNPAKYKARWNTSLIESCQGVMCGMPVAQIENVQSQINESQIGNLTSFKVGHAFNVSCARGYVSYTDPTAVTATVQCQQSNSDKSQGVWAPISNNPCVAVRCNASELDALVPRNAMIQSARNKVTQRQYDVKMQTSFLPLFNNIINLQCNDGFFYPDRQYYKQVICDLANNSLITGTWLGYLGTVLPLSPACQNSTCTYESIVITADLNVQTVFMMLNSLGVYVNQTQPTGEPYLYQTELKFFCKDGYSTGTGSPIQNLVCGPQGKWIPNLTPCISIVAPLNTGLAQHYVPPAVEAESAHEIGYVAIVILAVFLSLIVILDLSTLARDIKLMKSNILNLKAARMRSSGQ